MSYEREKECCDDSLTCSSDQPHSVGNRHGPFTCLLLGFYCTRNFFSSLFQWSPSWSPFILSDSLISSAPLFFFSDWFPSCFFSCLSLRSHLLLFKGRYLWTWGRGVSVLFLVHWAYCSRCTSLVFSFFWINQGSKRFQLLEQNSPRHLYVSHSGQLGLCD